jgi:ankyrin repeat protein
MRIAVAVILGALLSVGQVGAQNLTPAEAKQRLQEEGHGLSQMDYQSAVIEGRAGDVRLYLEAGYDPDSSLKSGGIELGFLGYAVGRHPDIVKLLLKYGADPNEPGLMAYPIHNALPHEKSMRALLQHGAVPSVTNSSGFHPIHSIVLADTASSVRAKAASVLLQYGADPNAETEKGDGKGATPLLLCAAKGAPGVARVLLENGASVTLEGTSYTLKKGYTLSKVARARGHTKTAAVIEEYE